MAKVNTADVGFEKQIWNAADVLRGSMDAAEYKHVVLGLIFLKYISDRFEAKYQELVNEGYGMEEDKDEYTAENIFYVPQKARWSVIAENAHKPEIGLVIDEAMRFIESNIDETPISLHFIRELHSLTVKDLSPEKEGAKHPGAFRTGNVRISGSSHTPPDSYMVEPLMRELVEFINSDTPAKYDLIKIAIAHHRFVWIHPFENGNGRVVRLFTYALLLKFVFKSKDRIINPTAVFCSDRNEYYKYLSMADNDPEEGMLAWAEYMLKGLKIEIEKLDKLLDYRYLQPTILRAALKDALDRKYITDPEYKILTKLIDQPDGLIQSSDISPIFPDKSSSDRSRMIKALVDKRMLRPISENARRYLLSFENNFLLRSILTQLDKNGFLPEGYNR